MCNSRHILDFMLQAGLEEFDAGYFFVLLPVHIGPLAPYITGSNSYIIVDWCTLRRYLMMYPENASVIPVF